MKLQAQQVQIGGAFADLQDYFETHGWTDGLPVVPPTDDLVEKMILGSGLPPNHEVGLMSPSQAVATVEKVAINAVMAGCRPEYMPVILAVLRAMAKPQWNMAGVQATTHPAAPAIIVHGPIRERIGINSGSNVFGQGNRANATIGRAVRLVMINIGQGVPGQTDMATFGTPCKYSFCGGENQEESPWTPRHVELGLSAQDSAVTVHAGEAPHNIQDHGSRVGEELLLTFASTMNTIGNNNAGLGGEMLVVVGPEHARTFADSGIGKAELRYALHKHMRLSFDRFGKGVRDWYRKRRSAIDVGPEIKEIPFFDDPSQILIVVAGGAGLHSMVVPSFGGMSMSVLEKIEEPAR